jgi:hypothetical protein
MEIVRSSVDLAEAYERLSKVAKAADVQVETLLPTPKEQDANTDA